MNATSLLTLETPKTIEEIQVILERARKNKHKVRVVGSQHSTENAIYGRGHQEGLIVLSMTRFDEIRFTDNRGPEANSKGRRAWVRVEAGVHVAEQPYIHPVPAEHAQLRRWLARKGVALNLVGGVTHQTVVGFLSTGSSGGSWRHCLHDMVVEIELVDGEGAHRTLSRFAKDAAEQAMFRAAGVSLGLLGVIVSVTLEVDDDYHVLGTETFGSLTGVEAERRGQLVKTFCRDEEYGRLIWWPQNDHVQRWAAQRVAPRPDMKPIPYMPVGQRGIMDQIQACLLLTLMGNLGTLDDLRRVPAKLARARLPEYLQLVAAQETLRPLADRETPIEVLQRTPHYHWTQSRYRAPRRLVSPSHGDVAVELVIELLQLSSTLDSAAFPRFVERLMLAAADEATKRLLYLAEGRDPGLPPAELRAALDRYGNIVSSMLQPDRDVGPIGAEEVWQPIEKLLRVIYGGEAHGEELVDHLGGLFAAVLLPISSRPETEPVKRLASLVHAFLKRAVYDQAPMMVRGFFEENLGRTTGFYDHALDGLAMDRRMNHHLIQTKFSEIWVKGTNAEKALQRLTEYMAGKDLGEAKGDWTAERPLESLREALERLPRYGDAEQDVDALSPGERFSRQGVYSQELYGGKADHTFLLYPGQGEECACQGPCECERNWVRINLFWFAHNEGTPRRYFEQFWRVLEEAGVEYRCHWGKEMPDAPRWDDGFRENIRTFLEQRRALDPHGLFYTDHWQALLEGR